VFKGSRKRKQKKQNSTNTLRGESGKREKVKGHTNISKRAKKNSESKGEPTR